MKRSLIFLLPFALGTALAGASGHSNLQDDRIEQGREMIRAGRVELIRDELQLTEAEADGFWPLYETYRAKSDAIMDRYAAMISEYMRRYNNADLTDEYADELVGKFFGIKRELLDVQESYVPRFRAVMSGLKVARFFQLENKTNAEIDAQLALVVPLVDPS